MHSEELHQAVVEGTSLLQAAPNVEAFALIGSALYLPADQVNDVDFAVLLKPGTLAFEHLARMTTSGDWKPCGEYDTTGSDAWGAVRKGNLNLMVTHDRVFFDGYKMAMEVCRVLNLTRKEDRIAVCRVVRDRVPAADILAEKADLF